MTKKRPLLLLSNDDGINAKGIHELIRALRPVGDLIVVAPDGPRSGASGAITSASPIQYALLQQEAGLALYKCFGHSSRLRKTGITCHCACRARFGDWRNQPRRQLFGKCALFGHNGSGY